MDMTATFLTEWQRLSARSGKASRLGNAQNLMADQQTHFTVGALRIT